MIPIDRLWSSLGATPLVWLVVTLSAYAFGNMLQRACGGSTGIGLNGILIGLVVPIAVHLWK